MEAEFEAQDDPNMRRLVEIHREREERKIPAWIQQIVEEAERAVGLGEIDIEDPKPSAEAHKPLEWRAEAYHANARRWLGDRGLGGSDDATDPVAVVSWLSLHIASKIRRATVGLANDDGESSEFPSDADGSAKAALVAIERSHAAWRALINTGLAAADTAALMLNDLAWLGHELERVFPKARAFVRPGFDEPDAMARLEGSCE